MLVHQNWIFSWNVGCSETSAGRGFLLQKGSGHGKGGAPWTERPPVQNCCRVCSPEGDPGLSHPSKSSNYLANCLPGMPPLRWTEERVCISFCLWVALAASLHCKQILLLWLQFYGSMNILGLVICSILESQKGLGWKDLKTLKIMGSSHNLSLALNHVSSVGQWVGMETM